MDARNHQLKKPPAPFAAKDHGGSACVHVGFGKLSAGDFDAAKPAIARQGWGRQGLEHPLGAGLGEGARCEPGAG
jgi:hypothetical protein